MLSVHCSLYNYCVQVYRYVHYDVNIVHIYPLLLIPCTSYVFSTYRSLAMYVMNGVSLPAVSSACSPQSQGVTAEPSLSTARGVRVLQLHYESSSPPPSPPSPTLLLTSTTTSGNTLWFKKMSPYTYVTNTPSTHLWIYTRFVHYFSLTTIMLSHAYSS